MHAKTVLAAATLAVACALPSIARADLAEQVDMSFASGATFSGVVTIADDFSHFTGVNGTLSGGGYGTDAINWVWDYTNYSTGSNNLSNFLMDGDGTPGADAANTGHYAYFVQLAVNGADPSHLSFTSGASYGGTDNDVEYSDAFVSGTISAVPETSNATLLLLGLGVVSAMTRKARATRQAALA